jgi:hypothetical protein
MGDVRNHHSPNCLILLNYFGVCGGGSGIRTLGGFSPSSVFKTGAFDHSAKPPCGHTFKQGQLILKGPTRALF